MTTATSRTALVLILPINNVPPRTQPTTRFTLRLNDHGALAPSGEILKGIPGNYSRRLDAEVSNDRSSIERRGGGIPDLLCCQPPPHPKNFGDAPRLSDAAARKVRRVPIEDLGDGPEARIAQVVLKRV